ncbi:Murein hydrolase activator EnvC [hydrothermal vent metagenome]|uniref:Murein hydrolase activator EnvC n=1 Tax=hydrothermal vent metagenome TaxID=652676 RepID=A0A3B1AD62_9ZZZZ
MVRISFYSGTLKYMMFSNLKWRTVLLSGLLSLLISALISPAVLYADDDEAALNKVRRDIGRMQKEIRETQMFRDSVQKEVHKLEIELASISKELKRVKSKIRKQRRKLNKLQKKRTNLKKDLKTQHKLLASQVKSAYMMGQQEYLKIILNLEDTSSIGRTMTYYNYFNQARLDRIKKSRNTLASLAAVEKKIHKQTAALKETKSQQTTKQKELKIVTQSRAIVVAELHKQLRNQEQDLSVLVENERRLQKLIRQLDEVMPAILTDPGNRTPFAKLKGKLNWPTKGKLRNIYGKKRKAGRVKWNGVMIMAQVGQDVKAVSHGRVAFAEFLRGYGLLLIIDHGDGYMSLYGHNQTIYKEIGEWVETGETIASIGTSGGQKHSGLYFEIRNNGKPSNPVRWFRSG